VTPGAEYVTSDMSVKGYTLTGRGLATAAELVNKMTGYKQVQQQAYGG